MPILFQGVVTKKDYRLALQMNIPFFKLMKWMLIFTLLPVSCVLFELIKDFVVTGGMERGEFSITELIPFLIVGLGFYTFPWWYLSILTASYSNEGNIYSKPISGQIDDSSITMGNPGLKEVTHQWHAYQKYKQTDRMVLLYTGPRFLQIFTRELFSNDTDWNLFLEQIHIRLKKK